MPNINIRYFLLLLTLTVVGCCCAGNDKQKTDNLLDSVKQYFYTNPIKGRNFVLELEKEAERQKDTRNQAKAKAKMVEYYYPQFDNDSIVAAAEAAETFARKHEEYDIMFVVQQTIIQRYANQGMFTLALAKARQMYDEARNLNDNLNMARATAALANTHKHMNQYEESSTYLHESLGLLRQTDGGATSALTLENYQELAFIGLSLEKYEQTILYADSMYVCINLRRKEKGSNDAESVFIAEYLLAQANIYLNRQEQAKKHIDKTEQLYNEDYPLSFRFLLDQMYVNYHTQRKEYQQAYTYNERMLQLIRQYELQSDLPEVLINKAELLAHLNRHSEAVQAYAEAIAEQKENNRSEYKLQLNELSILYDLNRIEQQAREDRMQLQFTRRIVVAIAVVALLLVVLAVVMYRNSRRINFKNKRLVLRLQEQDALAKRNSLLEEQIKELQPMGEDLLKHTDLQWLEALQQLMDTNKRYTDNKLSRKDVQEELNISEKNLRTLIMEHYGQTYSTYVSHKRVRHARQLLSDTGNTETVERIGYESGFGSRSTFYRQFREYYGLTPDEYRRHVLNREN
ncbi:helix-turn-helix transcriptional regulator [Dysgonomonas sp. 520]|uniref:helix-turn-helix transcriptional regulator n=1 Tax=Dysgonomonas sp. 520 TaxID=2302931 RepID=UPI0013D38D2C|nr:helix-turn-helix transcriptional regulator [Dysgonomonas sp. 520]